MFSKLATKCATLDVLSSFGLYTKHRLGQNFLIDDSVIGHILELADVQAHDYVIEIGPGIGTLSCALLPRVKRLCAIEADRLLPDVLAETLGEYADKFELISADALKVSADDIRAKLFSSDCAGSMCSVKLISNLPYQIAATAVLHYLEMLPELNELIVMVQSEVAQRMSACAAHKLYGAYSAKLALYAQCVGGFKVAPSHFFPAPHVMSEVIHIQRRSADKQLCKAHERAYVARVIDASFSQRRKTLLNCLCACGFDKQAVLSACESVHIDARTRAEKLTPSQFVELARALAPVSAQTSTLTCNFGEKNGYEHI